MRLQASLGRIQTNYRPDMNMSGYLTVARVLKVHHKSGTADVVVINTKDTYRSNSENEGRFSARIVTQFAGYDEKRQKAWGTITPLTVGSLVLLGFLDNLKSRPIILGQFHWPDNENNVLPTSYPLNPKKVGYERREAQKTLQVYPSLAYKKVDGESNIEFAHASKTFFAMYNSAMDVQDYLNDAHLGFDHEHLTETDPKTGETLETDIEEAKSPTKVLFVHRSSFEKENTTWTKFFISASGLLRVTRDNNDSSLTFSEISEKGKFTIRRQVDSSEHYEGENYSEISVEEDGTTRITRINGKTAAEVSIDKNGVVTIQHSSGSYIQMDENIMLEADKKIISDSLSKFIKENHLVVSFDEPEYKENLVWIDLN